MGRKVSETAPSGGVTSYTYDDSNRLTLQSSPMTSNSQKSEKKYTYDNNGNVKTESIKTNLAGSSTATYRTTEYSYDARNNLVKVQNGSGSNVTYTEYEYDGVGNLLKEKAANGQNVTSYTYDSQNRAILMKDPMGMTERYLYDTAGNMVTKYDRNGTELRYDYDAMNRITKEYAKAGNSEVLKSTYSYNGMNRLAEMNDGKTSISYQYNENNMLENTYVYQNGRKYQIFTGYDSRGNLTMKYVFQYIKSEYVEEDKIVYEYTYDNNNNLTNVKYSDRDEGLQTKDLVTYTYNNMDNVAKETRGNITTDYTYNMAGLVTGMTNKNGSSVISTYSNTYNYDGNVAKAVENGNTTTYTYDYMNRLVSEDNIYKKYEYEYDGAGNRIRMECNDKNYEDSGTEYTYDKNNRLIEEVEFVYSADEKHITDYKYDKNGNMLTKVKSIADTTSYERKQSLGIKTASELSKEQESEYFTYNVFNQLKEYRDTEGTSAKYEYMPNNYRYEKTVGGVKTRFLWDGDYVIGELDSTGNISKKYFYGKDMISDNSGNNYVYDIHGSVTNVLNSSGTKTETYEYNAFGRDEKSTINSISNPWQYCGEYKDNGTGLIYLRNRYYDPETGRFINEDPIRSGGNWYSYASQNPVMFVDSSGYYEVTAKNVREGVNALLIIGYENVKKVLKLSDFCSYEASVKAEEWGLSVTWDNKADAYRHFIWNYKSTEEIGFINTCVFMDAHEDKEQIYVGKNSAGKDCYLTPIASLMDINNNMYGRNMAQFENYDNADEAFESALNNGTLLLSLSETKEFYNIPNTWIYGAGDERYGNIYESVIIEEKISEIGGIPKNVKLVNPSDIKK